MGVKDLSLCKSSQQEKVACKDMDLLVQGSILVVKDQDKWFLVLPPAFSADVVPIAT